MPERVSITFDESTYERMQQSAHNDDRSLAAWIRVACREKLEREENKK